MSLIVNQGALPADGDTVQPATFLEDWINNTTIAGLDEGALFFTLKIVVSATTAPEPTRGLFWFERGAGKLYLRESLDRGGAKYPVKDFWVPIAPVRAIVYEGGSASAKGGVGSMSTGEDPGVLDSFYADTFGRHIPVYTQNSSTLTSPATRQGIHTLLALDSGASGFPVLAAEWGFVQGVIACGGSNVARGAFVKQHRLALGPDFGVLNPRVGGWTGETNYDTVGVIVETNATTSLHLATIFKRPTKDWMWRTA